MKRKPYPTYKPSGVEWLGDVPEHWEVKKSRFMLVMNPSKQEISYLPSETEVSFLPMEAVGDDGNLNLETVRPIVEVIAGYTYFAEGDVTFAKITPCFENGKGAIMRGLLNSYGFGTTELTVLRPGLQVNNEYLYYLTISSEFRKKGAAWMYGAGGQKRVPDDFVREFCFSWPPLPEQQTIAAFLDRETVRIDTLVAKKERLIELLREKRSALISHAVTKGLDSSVKLKLSGVEWLGNIPEHWEVKAVWHVYFLGRGRVISHEDIADNPGEYPVYSSQTENDGELGCLGTYDFDGDYITWTTDGANAGTVFRRRGKFNCTNVCGTLKAKIYNSSIENGFVAHALNLSTPEFVRHDINPKLMNNVMAKIRFALPPLHDQQAITSYLDRETGKIEALIAKVEAAIAKLKEYRTALISAAVTGKTDVREAA